MTTKKLFAGIGLAALILTGLCSATTARANVPTLYQNSETYMVFSIDFDGQHRNPYNYYMSTSGLSYHWYQPPGEPVDWHPASLKITGQKNLDANDATFTGVLYEGQASYPVTGTLTETSSSGSGYYITFDATWSFGVLSYSEHYEGALLINAPQAGYMAGLRTWTSRFGIGHSSSGLTPFDSDASWVYPPPK